jgi:hypothetical protein
MNCGRGKNIVLEPSNSRHKTLDCQKRMHVYSRENVAFVERRVILMSEFWRRKKDETLQALAVGTIELLISVNEMPMINDPDL